MSLVTSFELGNDEIAEIEKHLTLFVEWFYHTYYQRSYDCLPACKYTVHSRIHLVHDVRNWGSASYFWQFPEVKTPHILLKKERLCGILVRDIQSRVKGAENLTVILHQHQLLAFADCLGIIPPNRPTLRSSFTTEAYGPLYSLHSRGTTAYKLSSSQFKHLQQHYVTIF